MINECSCRPYDVWRKRDLAYLRWQRAALERLPDMASCGSANVLACPSVWSASIDSTGLIFRFCGSGSLLHIYDLNMWQFVLTLLQYEIRAWITYIKHLSNDDGCSNNVIGNKCLSRCRSDSWPKLWKLGVRSDMGLCLSLCAVPLLQFGSQRSEEVGLEHWSKVVAWTVIKTVNDEEGTTRGVRDERNSSQTGRRMSNTMRRVSKLTGVSLSWYSN